MSATFSFMKFLQTTIFRQICRKIVCKNFMKLKIHGIKFHGIKYINLIYIYHIYIYIYMVRMQNLEYSRILFNDSILKED